MARTLYIKAGSLIDGSGAPLRRKVFLAIKNGIITGIGPLAEFPRDETITVDDLSQYTIVPALVDCSVSLSHSPSVDSKVRLAIEQAGIAEKTTLAAQHIRYCRSHGILGLAESDDSIDLLDHLKKGMPGKISIDLRTAGRDFLRIVYADILENAEPSGSGLTPEDLRSILQQKGDRKAVVVANGQQQVKEALAAGCDAVEQGYGMGDDNLRKMADMDVMWVPSVLLAKNGLQGAGSGGDVTCRFSRGYVAPGKADPGAEAFWEKMLAGQLAQLRLARELGLKTAVGTGAGNVGILHGESMVEEMKLFTRAGWSWEEVIRSASVIGAGFFGMEDLGVLAIGRKATFLAARGTVQQLPRKLAYLEKIYIEGRKWEGKN